MNHPKPAGGCAAITDGAWPYGICDYVGGYDDLTPFLDYPGHVVNCSLTLGDRKLLPTEVAQLFGRPYMGGLERKGVIATGSAAEVRTPCLPNPASSVGRTPSA